MCCAVSILYDDSSLHRTRAEDVIKQDLDKIIFGYTSFWLHGLSALSGSKAIVDCC